MEEDFSLNNFNWGIISPEENDIIVVQYPLSEFSVGTIKHLSEKLNSLIKKNFPNNSIVYIPNDLNISTHSQKELVDKLRAVADKIEKEFNESME
jgi:hypothetical protein